MRTSQARPMRSRPHPSSVGRDENPKPGRDGMTTSKASSARPPYAVGSVSGPIALICSKTEPGHPCETISGSAFSWRERTWKKCTSTPSIVVTYCGHAFSCASALRQSYSLPQ